MYAMDQIKWLLAFAQTRCILPSARLEAGDCERSCTIACLQQVGTGERTVPLRFAATCFNDGYLVGSVSIYEKAAEVGKILIRDFYAWWRMRNLWGSTRVSGAQPE